MYALKRTCEPRCNSVTARPNRTSGVARLLHARNEIALEGARAATTLQRRWTSSTRKTSWQARKDVVCQAGKSSGDPWWLKDNPANMKDIHSIQELVDALADAGDRMVIVEFYAQWCNACRALFPKLCRLVGENPDVLFLKVNFDENRDACRTLAVKVLPYFHFYRGAEGRVAAFSCTISKLQLFKDALENFSSPFCSLEPTPGLAEFPTVVPHPELQGATSGSSLTSSVEEEELHPLADTPTVVG